MTAISLKNSISSFKQLEDSNFVPALSMYESYTRNLFQKISIYIIVLGLRNQVKSINDSLKKNSKTIDAEINSAPKSELIKSHSSLSKTLDSLSTKRRKYPNSFVFNSLVKQIDTFIAIIKDLEMKMRLKAYPERNEIALTYDELKELLSLTSSFECASEQSDSYSNH